MSERTSVALPGTTSPAAGFDAPFEMLAGCHERVRRTLALLQRLVGHLGRQGVDAQARDAARDVCRYFDLAAPQHHEDEERHVIPRLLASDDPRLREAARTMQADHLRMHAAWSALGERLRQLHAAADGPMAAEAHAALASSAAAFAALYDSHIPLEDGLAFPAARAALDGTALAAMGAEMALRRGVHNPAPWSPPTS